MDLEKISKPVGLAAGWVTVVAGAYSLREDIVLAAAAVGGAVLGTGGLLYRTREKERYAVMFPLREIELDFQTADAQTVLQKRRNTLRALKDNVTHYDTHMSADGGLESLHVDRGVISQVRREGGDLFVRTQLPRPLKKGERFDSELSCKLSNSFTNSENEYWSVRVSDPTELCRLIVRFHKDKPYKSYRGFDRFTTYEVLADTQPHEENLDGRPSIVWDVPKPKVGHVYKLVWEW